MPKIKRTVICIDCGEEKIHHGLERCQPCYWNNYKNNKKKESTEDGLTFDNSGRINYHPDFHDKHGNEWTREEFEYLCKFYEIDDRRSISFALGRTEGLVATKVNQLRKNGLYEHYKQSYERKLES